MLAKNPIVVPIEICPYFPPYVPCHLDMSSKESTSKVNEILFTVPTRPKRYDANTINSEEYDHANHRDSGTSLGTDL